MGKTTEKKQRGIRFPVDLNLRDYFAAAAMQAMCAGPGAEMVAKRDKRFDETNWAEIVALNAYYFADAMLRARAAESQA